jgi:allantoate deiminase
MTDLAATVMERCETLGRVSEEPDLLTALLARAVEELGYRVEHLPSGAGHDAAQMAMLFVRCKGGVSHNPAESVEQEDVAVAIEVTSRFLALAAEERR